MKNIKQFFTYLVVGALVAALSISCKSNEEPGGASGLNIPTATGSPATVANAEFSGPLENTSLTGEGWTQEQIEGLAPVNPFLLSIQDSKLYLGATMRGEQLLCPNSSNPNIIEVSKETVLGEGTDSETTYTEYIKITLDDANNPTTAGVEYHFKLYVPAYAYPGHSDTVVAIYQGTLNKVTSSGS